jgi:hypothetical protein
MKRQNIELHESVKTYIKAAIKYAREVADAQSSDFEFTTSSLLFIRKDFDKIPEYQRCFSAFGKDPVVFGQFNQLTGVGFARSRSWPLETFMLHLPQLLGIYDDRFEFNEAFFEAGYSKLEETFYNDEISFEVTVPLQGPKFSELIKVEDNLEICLVNSKDLRPIIDNANVKRNYEDNQFDLETCWAIRTSYKLPKILGEKEDDLEKRKKQDKENEEKRECANEIVEQVVIALRLFCYFADGFRNIYPATVLHRANSLLCPQVRPFRIRYFPEYSFSITYNENFGKSFLQFWHLFRSEKILEQKCIGIAARRFSFAYERYNWQDKLVDLIVAAEAIFLGRNERRISHSLAERASAFLHTDLEVRKQIFADFKQHIEK